MLSVNDSIFTDQDVGFHAFSAFYGSIKDTGNL